MKVSNVLVEINSYEYSYIVKFLLKNNIYYKDLKLSDNTITLETDKESYDLLKKELKSVKIIKYKGVFGVFSFLKKHFILVISFLITYVILLVLSNMIFSIEIVSTNNELKRIINLYLKENGIEKYKFMKSYDELSNIKEIILEENKSTIEWLEIERVGTKYVINITERVINPNENLSIKSNIVASKDAKVMYIVTKSGTKMKEVNEIVKKGEVLISGNVYKDEEIVDTLEAKGEVYGEVWYTVTTIVPFSHVEYEKTGEVVNHIYLDVFGKKITLMGKYDTNSSFIQRKVILDKPYLFFKVIKERKELYNYKTHNLSHEEAYNEAIKRSDKSVSNKLSSEEYIIEKKVLKKNVYSSKIELEIFYRVYESIGEIQEIIDEPLLGE